MLPDVGAELLPQHFGWLVAVGGRVARVPVRLRCEFASVTPFAFKDISAFGAAVVADVTVHAVSIVNELPMLVRVFRLMVTEWMNRDRDDIKQTRQGIYTYECGDGKDAGEKISVVRANSVVDVEVHNEEEVRWIIVFSLIYPVYVSDVGAHKPSHYVVCHLAMKESISRFISLTLNKALWSGYRVDIPCLNEPCIPEAA